jgi:hypothetical protein
MKGSIVVHMYLLLIKTSHVHLGRMGTGSSLNNPKEHRISEGKSETAEDQFGKSGPIQLSSGDLLLPDVLSQTASFAIMVESARLFDIPPTNGFTTDDKHILRGRSPRITNLTGSQNLSNWWV